MTQNLVLLVWVPILGYVAWCWAGRSRRARSWAGDPFMHGLVLGAAPGCGLMLFGLWLGKMFGDVMMPVAGLLWVFSILLFVVFGIYHPRWWGPRWFHRLSDKQKVNVRNRGGGGNNGGSGTGT